jgi:hypothetical protein
VVRVIERGKPEISVAPRRQRVFGRLVMVAPELVGRLAGATAVKLADVAAAGQADKR